MRNAFIVFICYFLLLTILITVASLLIFGEVHGIFLIRVLVAIYLTVKRKEEMLIALRKLKFMNNIID